MKTTTIPGTTLVVSRFIFGTASLFNAGTRGFRYRLLRAAVDHGFTHFDTAPYYGFGMAESDLGAAIPKSSEITITTKVGLYPPGGAEQSATGIFARKVAGKILHSLSRPIVDFSLERARRSLDGSLKRLRRDAIDLFMLHEPHPALLSTDEWRKWLDREVTAGKIRLFGIALEAGALEPFLRGPDPLSGVVQTTDSIDGREADVLTRWNKEIQITYGYVSAARRRAVDEPVPTILGRALERNRKGAIIVSTRRVERIPQYERLAEAGG